MDIFKMMQTGEGIEHLEEHLLNLDSEFRFKCRRCGKCCIHQETIIFNARDIYNIAKKKGMTVQEVVNAYTEAYIGRNSHILHNGRGQTHKHFIPEQIELVMLRDSELSQPTADGIDPLGGA